MSTEITFAQYRNSTLLEMLAMLNISIDETTEYTYIYLKETDSGFSLEYAEKTDRESYFEDEIEGSYVSSYAEWLLQQVLTPSEIERELKLSSGTVRQYLSRHGDAMAGKGEARKADGRTWLIRRDVAYRIWLRQGVIN